MYSTEEINKFISDMQQALRSSNIQTRDDARKLCIEINNISNHINHDARGYDHFRAAEEMINSDDFHANPFLHRLELFVSSLPHALLSQD